MSLGHTVAFFKAERAGVSSCIIFEDKKFECSWKVMWLNMEFGGNGQICGQSELSLIMLFFSLKFLYFYFKTFLGKRNSHWIAWCWCIYNWSFNWPFTLCIVDTNHNLCLYHCPDLALCWLCYVAIWRFHLAFLYNNPALLRLVHVVLVIKIN